MESKVVTRLKRFGPNLSLTGVIVTLAVGVILPVLLSTSVGIVSLAVGEGTVNLVVGVLVICFAAAAIGGAVTATVLLGRKARTARLQSDFLANVSHELRTPLAAIRMYTQTLRSGKLQEDPERTAECLATIERESQWLETMIERVLTWRSAAKDRQVLELQRAPLEEAVEEALKRFTALTAPGELQLVRELESHAPVQHDPRGIAMVILNLLINAYKYSPEEKHITLRTRDESGLAVLEVEDRGIGIPARERDRIFQPFYRVDDRLSRRAGGAGLGLAIVRALVEAHGGTVQAGPANAGPGTRFTVRLPHASTDAPENVS